MKSVPFTKLTRDRQNNNKLESMRKGKHHFCLGVPVSPLKLTRRVIELLYCLMDDAPGSLMDDAHSCLSIVLKTIQ